MQLNKIHCCFYIYFFNFQLVNPCAPFHLTCNRPYNCYFTILCPKRNIFCFVCFQDNLLLGLFPLQQLCLIIYLYFFIAILFIAQQALYIISTSCCNLARALMEECSGGNEASSENGVVDPTDSKVKHINVLVTSGSLIPSLVKCMLFRLDDLIAYKNG